MKQYARHRTVPAVIAIVLLITLLLPGTSVFAASKPTKKIVPKKETGYDIEDGTESFAYQIQYQYDKKGRLKKDSEKNTNETSSTTYKYNKKGDIKSWITKVDGVNNTKEVITYKKNKKVMEQDYDWDSVSGTWQKSGYYKYSISKKRTVMDCYTAAGVLSYHNVDTFNKKGLLISTAETDFDEETGAVTQTKKVKITYNKYGLITSERYNFTYSDGTSGSSVDIYKYSNFYKKNKKYPRQTLIYSDGLLTRKIVTSYKTIK